MQDHNIHIISAMCNLFICRFQFKIGFHLLLSLIKCAYLCLLLMPMYIKSFSVRYSEFWWYLAGYIWLVLVGVLCVVVWCFLFLWLVCVGCFCCCVFVIWDCLSACKVCSRLFTVLVSAHMSLLTLLDTCRGRAVLTFF